MTRLLNNRNDHSAFFRFLFLSFPVIKNPIAETTAEIINILSQNVLSADKINFAISRYPPSMKMQRSTYTEKTEAARSEEAKKNEYDAHGTDFLFIIIRRKSENAAISRSAALVYSDRINDTNENESVPS